MRHVTVTDADDGNTVELAVGDILDVVLEGNAGTGFVWMERALPDCIARLEDVPGARNGMSAATDKDAVFPGRRGHFRFAYRANASCSGEADFVYARSWETGKPPARVRTYRITVAAAQAVPAR